MLQTKTARWSALTALACVALLGIAWVLLLSPRRAEAADIRDQAEAARSANDALQLQVAQLKAQFAELPKNKAELATIHTQMPVKAAMPELVRAVDAAAAASGVTLTALTPAGATALATAPAAAPSPAASSAAGSTGGTAAAAPAAPAAGGLRVVAIPVTIVVQGDYFQNVLFLKKLQTEMPRVFAVNSLQMVVGAATGSGVTMTVGGSVFALPDAVDTTDAAASGAAATGTGTTGTGTGTTGTGTTGGTAPGQATAWGGMSRVGATASRVAEDS